MSPLLVVRLPNDVRKQQRFTRKKTPGVGIDLRSTPDHGGVCRWGPFAERAVVRV